MPHRPFASQVPETFRIAIRVAWRLGILVAFAFTGTRPFWPTLTTLLVLATGLCLLIALARGEFPLGPTLNHWDEAALYGLLSRAILLAGPAAGPA